MDIDSQQPKQSDVLSQSKPKVKSAPNLDIDAISLDSSDTYGECASLYSIT